MSKLIGPHIKAVFFDHDDTLVATIEAKWAQHKHVAKKHYNKELLDDELREHWGKPLTELVGLIFETDDLDLAMKRVLEVHRDFPKKLFDSTIGVLERLRQQNKLVGVVTGSVRESFEYDIDELGIPRALFDYTQTEEDSMYHKPDPRVFDQVIEWLSSHGIEPHEVVYVGDNYVDMQAAQAAGFEFIGAATGLVSVDDFTKKGAIAVSELSELVD